MTEFVPASFAAFVELPATKTEKAYRHRLGNFRTLEEAKAAIKREKEHDWSCGGLLPLGPSRKRRHSIWRATGWTKVEG